MSTCDSLPRRRDDDGFTLIEIVVALGLLAVVMTAALPVFVSMLRATVVTRMDTQAKNLAQQRLDQMRNLRFHVDQQNGPFLDLLDMYYTNANSAGVPITVPNTTLTGKYVAAGAGAGGEPTGPYYRVTTGPLADATDFQQVIAVQFLAPDGSTVPAARYQNSYNSQVAGADQPPTLMLGVTVITNWTQGANPKSYRTYTRITDSRPGLPVIQSQSRAVAVDITSTAKDGTTLQLRGGLANVDGAQSSGSSVSGYAVGALATQTGQSAVSGAAAQFALPASGPSSSGSTGPQSGGGTCSWYGFGSTDVVNVTGDLTGGLPKAPSNVDAATPPNRLSGHIAKNGGGTCGQLMYNNLAGGGVGLTSPDPLGVEMGAVPYVRIPDTTSGSGPSIAGSGYVTATALTATPKQVRSGAAVSMAQSAVLFPGTPEPSSGRGLVSAAVTTGSVDCVSGAPGTVTGKYTLSVGWWGRHATEASAEWHEATWTYDSTATPVMVQSGDTWDPANTYLSNGTTLSQLVSLSPTSGTPNTVTTGATNGLRGFPSGIITLTTASTRDSSTDPANSASSTINVKLGHLTCVADDVR